MIKPVSLYQVKDPGNKEFARTCPLLQWSMNEIEISRIFDLQIYFSEFNLKIQQKDSEFQDRSASS